MSRPTVVFVLGGPGAGKGTQCERISQNLDFKHISAGDCLREERNDPNSKYSDLIESYMKEGKIVPVEVTVNLLRQKMIYYGWKDGKFVIDGFPRNQNNLEGWKKVIGDDVDVKFCLFFDCDEDQMVNRLLDRGKNSGRVDDNIESIRKRFNTYKIDTIPIIEWFEQQNKLRRISAIKSIDEVWNDVQQLFKNEI